MHTKYTLEKELEYLLKYFNYEPESIEKKELKKFIRHEVLKMSNNPRNLEVSYLKIFSIYQVAIIFIYQELFRAVSYEFFNSCIKTSEHKKDIPSLLKIAYEFGTTYISLEDKNQIFQINKVFSKELKSFKTDMEDDENLESIYLNLFHKDDSFSIQTHLSCLIKIQDSFIDKESYDKKLFSKNDIFSLLILFQMYHDKSLLIEYEQLKSICNLTEGTNLKIQKEIKFITNDYLHSKDSKLLERFNYFFISLTEYIKNLYLIPIDESYIELAFTKISKDIRTTKWYDRVLMKKDNYLLVKNTIQIQRELLTLQQNYETTTLDTKIFKGDFKLFSSVSVLVAEYDKHFNTIEGLSKLTEKDFSDYKNVACINIKNFYEESKNPITIKAINRFMIFWMQLSKKTLNKKIGE